MQISPGRAIEYLPMNPVTLKQGSLAIVYDADALPEADRRLFDPAHWRALGALEGTAPGRGTTCFLDAPFGRAVLREYLRGGWPAHITRDRYLFTGLDRSRPFREFHLLRRVRAAGLDVPPPLAALARRGGLTYGGALLTRRLEDVTPLERRLGDADLDWRAVGHGLRRFHDAGLRHADLNARNVLVGDAGARVCLVDLDRARFDPGRAVDGRRNLGRLKRSLAKHWPAENGALETCWGALLDGYRG